MKMLTATVKNATLTPAEFNYFCFYLQMAWPCTQADGGLVLEGISVEGIYRHPRRPDIIATAEEYLRHNIRRICEIALTHHGEPGGAEKSYSLSFSYSDETPEGGCERFTPGTDNAYPLCDKPDCMLSGTCCVSAHMNEPNKPYPGE